MLRSRDVHSSSQGQVRSKERFVLFSGHDGTLLAILSALRLVETLRK